MDKGVSMPWEAEMLEDGSFDREFDDKDFAAYFHAFLSSGVYPNPSNNLKVEARYSNMVVTVGKGFGLIEGRFYKWHKDMEVRIDEAHPSQRRIDSIILEANYLERKTQVVYVPGEPSSNPVAEELVRNDDKYQLRLAKVTVPSGAVSLSNANVKDTRLDKNQCGLVHAAVESVDTTELFNQYSEYLAEQMERWNQEVDDWSVIKLEQINKWEEQTELQKIRFNDFLTEAEAEWARIKINADKGLHPFDFDNLSRLQGADIDTDYGTGYKTETISIAKTGFLIATRETSYSQGKKEVEEKVYDEDGKTIIENPIMVTTYSQGKKKVTVR